MGKPFESIVDDELRAQAIETASLHRTVRMVVVAVLIAFMFLTHKGCAWSDYDDARKAKVDAAYYRGKVNGMEECNDERRERPIDYGESKTRRDARRPIQRE